MRWRPFELAALVIGFAMWWPLGLAVIALKIAQRRGYAVEGLYARAQDAFSRARPFAQGPRQWQPFAAGTGNSAFDDWRNAELAKLEEERRKLDAAHKAFADHLDNLRRARDREEFESFMAARRDAQPGA
jgi:biopolymer transport protein ExbB/TolQ